MGKESACNAGDAGDLGSSPRSGRSPGGGWQSTPGFLPGESQGQRALAGYGPWGREDSDTNEATEYTQSTREALNVLQFSPVAQVCPALGDPRNRSTQASLSITNSRSSLRLTSIASVMPSGHLILGRPLLLLPPIPPSISLFQ